MAADPPLPPPIAAQLNHLLAYSPLPVKVEQMWSGCRNGRYCDRFSLLIPFCLDYVKWEVIFNAYHPSAVPDFIFSAEDAGFNPLLEAHEREAHLNGLSVMSPLVDWNYKDPSRLLSLIFQFRDSYINYQKKRAQQVDDERMSFEISTVLARKGTEVSVASFPDRDEVKFAVPIPELEFNKLVTPCPWKQEQKIYLQAFFVVAKGYAMTPPVPRLKLVSTQDLKPFLNVEDIKLAPWSDQMCMLTYLSDLEVMLNDQVVEAVAGVAKRRRFIEALSPFFGRPIEADPVFCRRASVLGISGVFSFLVHFSIPPQFPNKQPILKLESTQHFNFNGLPIVSSPINDYPWSPRWDNTTMAERIYDFLVEECLNFKKYCNDTIPTAQ
ncbi:BRCA1-A complex subunit BRE-like protein [Carex rostrata]